MSELLQVTQLSSCSCCLFTLPPSVDYPCSSLWSCTWAACCCLHADKLAGAPGSLCFGGYRPRRARKRENLQRKHFSCFCRLLTESAPPTWSWRARVVCSSSRSRCSIIWSEPVWRPCCRAGGRIWAGRWCWSPAVDEASADTWPKSSPSRGPER